MTDIRKKPRVAKLALYRETVQELAGAELHAAGGRRKRIKGTICDPLSLHCPAETPNCPLPPTLTDRTGGSQPFQRCTSDFYAC